MSPRFSLALVSSFALASACSPDASRARPPPTSAQLSEELAGDPHPPPDPGGTTPMNDDAPEITRSVGASGGILIMWPRLARGAEGAEGMELAGKVQRKLRDIAAKAVPGATIEVRPDPERACPRPKGCVAATLGAIVRKKDGACAVVALVSGSGPSPQRIVQWAGAIKADALTVPFRDPPETHVKVTDYASCSKIDEALAAHEDDIAAAIRAAVPR